MIAMVCGSVIIWRDSLLIWIAVLFEALRVWIKVGGEREKSTTGFEELRKLVFKQRRKYISR